MKVFSKNISEETWQEHLYLYSKTLVHHTDQVLNLLSSEHKNVTIGNIYMCPLCLKNYFVNTRNGIQGNAEFSLDHVPPESAGGRYKLITCKKCNNDSGFFESALEKMLNFAVDKKNPNNLLIRKVQVEDPDTGKTIKGDLLHNEDRTEILFDKTLKEFNPNYIEFLSNLKNKKKLKLDIPLFDTERVEKALLKSAYLLCFIWWGYEFSFSENGMQLRKAINGEIKYPIRFQFHKMDDIPTEVCLLNYESKRMAFLVNIALKGIDSKTTACVIIPNPTVDGWSVLEKISKLQEANPEKFSFDSLPMVIHRKGYTISWNIVLE